MPTSRKRLKLLKPGQLLGSTTANALISFVNAFQSATIVNGSSNDILIGDNAIIFKIKSASSVSGGGNSSYRGEYSPDGVTQFGTGPFLFGDIVRVSPISDYATTSGGSIIPGVYVCRQSSPTLTDLPNHPLSAGGEGFFWHWLSTYPSVRQVCSEDGTISDIFIDGQDEP